MNDDFQRFSNELSRIPCPLCRYSMRLKLSLRLLMTQYKDLCDHCKDKLSFSGDKRCICKEKTRTPVDQEENELYKRIKNFYKSIVPSPKLIHKTKILPFLDEYNPFQSLSVPNFSHYDTKTRDLKLADSEPNLSGGRPSGDQSFRKYDREDLKETHPKYQSDAKGERYKSDREHGSSRDREYATARDRDLSSARDREYSPTRDRGEYGPTRDQDAKTVTTTPGGKSQFIDKTMHDPYDKANVAGKDTRDELKFHLEKKIDRLRDNKETHAADRGVIESKHTREKPYKREGETDNRRELGVQGMEANQAKTKIEKDRDEPKVKKGKYGVKDLNDNEEKVKKGVYPDKGQDVPESKTKKDKDTEKEKGVFQGKVKTEKGNEKVKYAEKGKGVFEGKEKRENDRDKAKDVSEAKVKKTKDPAKEKPADKEMDVAEGKLKKEKEIDQDKKDKKDQGVTKSSARKEKDGGKIKYAEKGKGVFESKVKKENDGDEGKEGNEEKEKKGKGKFEKSEDKDKERDEERGKKNNEKESQKSYKDKKQIDLDILSFSERRELEKKAGGTHKKKAVHKGKKGKDYDKKMDEQRKYPKSERSGDEYEPDKDKSKSKKKDADIDDDRATPLTYTEDSQRQTVNPFLVRGEKKTKRKISKKSIGKKSAALSEKIMTPAVKPKILELIKKLTKTPRIRDKYFDRQSSRLSRYLNFDESDRLTTSEKSFLDLLNTPSPFNFHKVIVGNRVIKYKSPMHKFSECEEDSISVKPRIYVKYEEKPAELVKDRMESGDDANANDLGVLCYSLSDRSFISKGYTILPTEKIMRKLNVYRMRPSNPHNDWFARNRRKKTINYTSGQKLAVFEGDERCRIYYKNGNVALDYYQAEDNHAQERIVLYSDGENELKQKVPVTVLATFDHMGTGVIFDKKGNIRAKYNQNEGVVLDKTLGPYTKWKWHKLNDPPVLEEIMVDTVLPNKDPRIRRMHSKEQLPREVDEKILEIEFQNSLKEKGKKIFKSFKPFPIKMKAFKINDQFSLHIIDQSKIYLAFRDGSTSFRIDVGMILDCNEIIDMETSEMGEVPVPFEHKPARTSSVHNLQRSVEQAQLLERKRHKRNQRTRPLVEPCQSLERMRSAISRPLRKNIQGHHSDAVLSCSCRKYYNLNENNL